MTVAKHFQQKNKQLIESFMLHAEDGDTLTVVKPVTTFLGELGKEADATTVVYQKRKHSDSISVINEDGKYKTTLWETTPENIQTALRAGLFDAEALEQSPIAQIIADYGKYNAITLTRQVEREGLTSKKYNEKTFIVKIAQDAIFKLQSLWECVNNYDEALTPAENIAIILKKLNELENDFKVFLEIAGDDEYRAILRHIIGVDGGNLIINLREKIKEHFIANINADEVRSLLSPVADTNPLSGSIMHFVQDQIELINDAANKANNEISAVLDDRGELFNCIKRAEIHTRKMNENPDYHNSAPEELSLRFGKQVQKGELITIDLQKYGAKVESKADLAYQITVLEHIEETGQCLQVENISAVDQLQPHSTIEMSAAQQPSASLTEVKEHKESKDANQATEAKRAASFPISKKPVDSGKEIKIKRREESFWGMNWNDWTWASVGRTFVRFWSAVVGAVFFDLLYTGLNLITFGLLFSKFYNAEEKGFLSEKIERKFIGQDPREKAYEARFAKTIMRDDFTQFTQRSVFSGINSFVLEQLKKLIAQPVWEIIVETVKNIYKSGNRIKYDWTIGTEPMSDTEISFLLKQKSDEAAAEVARQNEDIDAFIQEFNRIKQDNPANFASLRRKAEMILEKEDIKSVQTELHNQDVASEKQREEKRQKRFNEIYEALLNDLRNGKDVGLDIRTNAATYTELAAGLKKLAKNNKNKVLARTSRYRHPDKPCDAVSSASEGYQILFEVFSDEIYKMHPVCGMGFTTLGLLGGLPFVAASLPANVPFIKAFMTKLSLPIAKALVGHESGFMAGFSTALIEGKLAFCFLDTLKRGPNSFLVNRLIKGAAENPIVAGAASLFAYGVGVLVAFKLNIPWFSEKIADEAQGTFPGPELGFAGAKIFAIIAEGLIDLSENTNEQYVQSRLERLRAELKKEVTAEYLARFKKAEKDLDKDDEQKIEEATAEFMKWVTENRTQENVIELVNNYREAIKDQRIIQEGELIKLKNRTVTSEQLTQEFCAETEIRFQDELNRARLNRLDIEKLTEEDKYKLYQWTQKKYYATDPEYVASVREKLYKQEKTSPVATSIRIATAYLPDFIRFVSSGLQVLVYLAIYGNTGKKSFKFFNSLEFFMYRAQDFSLKVRGDFGLVVRASQKILKSTYVMASALLLSAATVVVDTFAVIGAAFESLVIRPLAAFVFGQKWRKLRAIIGAGIDSFRSRPIAEFIDTTYKLDTFKPVTTFFAFKYALNSLKFVGGLVIPALILFYPAVIVGGSTILVAGLELYARSIASLAITGMATIFKWVGQFYGYQNITAIGAKIESLNPTTLKPVATFSAFEKPLNLIKSAWKFLTQPKLGMRLMESATGLFRKAGTQKEIQLASQDAEKRKVLAINQKYKVLFETKQAEDKENQSTAPSTSTARMLVEPGVVKPKSLTEAVSVQTSSCATEGKRSHLEASIKHEKRDSQQFEKVVETDKEHDKKLFEILKKHAYALKGKFNYRDSVNRFFDNELHETKKAQAGKILEAVNPKKDLYRSFSHAITEIKNAITEVNRMRYKIDKEKQGAFEQQLNDGLMSLYNSINNDSALAATDRAQILVKVRELIQLNRHEHVIEIKSAFKEFLEIKFTRVSSDNEFPNDLKQLARIHDRIRYLKFNASHESVQSIWEAIKAVKLNGKNMHMLAKNAAHDIEDEKKKYSFFERHFSSDARSHINSRVEAQIAYEQLLLGLTKLSKHFASDRVMSREIMECYNSLPAKLIKHVELHSEPVADATNSNDIRLVN